MLTCPLHNCLDLFEKIVGDVDTKELKTLDPLNYSPVDVGAWSALLLRVSMMSSFFLIIKKYIFF